MIHQYKLNGYNIVLDVYSGSIHITDNAAYDAIRYLDEGKKKEEAARLLEEDYRDRGITPEDVADIFADIEELRGEKPSYDEITLKWIEESEQPALAEQYDYYSVPSLFYRGEKLYEAHFTHSYDVIKEHIRSAFEQVLSA